MTASERGVGTVGQGPFWDEGNVLRLERNAGHTGLWPHQHSVTTQLKHVPTCI